jgi:hypothetical protein
MRVRFKIGDVVNINSILLDDWSEMPKWYSDEDYEIIGFSLQYHSSVILDRNMPDSDDTIHYSWLKLSIKGERKRKLKKIENVG